MIGRTNSGSGGGISPNAAVLAVTTFAGASVTITNGSTSKTKDATKAHVIDADNDRAVYIFSIGQGQFGTWAVAVTSDGITQTKTIAITAVEFYEITVRARVPDEYQEVEYIQATGTQRIEVLDSAVAQYSASSSYIMTLKCTLSDVANMRHVFGANDDVNRVSLLNNSSSRQSFFYGLSDQVATSGVTANTIYTYVTSIINGTATLVKNGITAGSHSIDALPSTNQFIYSIKPNESSNYNAKGNIYYFKYEIDGVINNELFPCYRKSDSVAGMYDRVKKQFVPNQGTGNFIVGSDVNP